MLAAAAGLAGGATTPVCGVALGAGAGSGAGGGLRSGSILSICAVGTSIKLVSSEVLRNSRVVLPTRIRFSWRIVNPLRRIATSVADAVRQEVPMHRASASLILERVIRCYTVPASGSMRIGGWALFQITGGGNHVIATKLAKTGSKAVATPFWAFDRVTFQPRPRSSSDAFPIITGYPAKASISISL